MPGIAPYLRTLAAGARTKIDARGTTVFVRRTTETLLVTARSSQVGSGEAGGQGVSYTLRMAASEKWFTAEEFDSVTIQNTGAASTNIEILLGFGDFFRPVPDIVNVSIDVPASRQIPTTVDNAAFGVGNANLVEVLPINLNRIVAIITALAANDQIIRIGDSNVDTDQGTPLSAGETLAIASTAAISVCEEVAGTNAVAIREETI